MKTPTDEIVKALREVARMQHTDKRTSTILYAVDRLEELERENKYRTGRALYLEEENTVLQATIDKMKETK